jgi:hypothetical protein
MKEMKLYEFGYRPFRHAVEREFFDMIENK